MSTYDSPEHVPLALICLRSISEMRTQQRGPTSRKDKRRADKSAPRYDCRQGLEYDFRDYHWGNMCVQDQIGKPTHLGNPGKPSSQCDRHGRG
jgi:hypothetical protein